jgi:hypothetical protein
MPEKSDLTAQILANLTYEVAQLAASHSRFCERLNDLNPNLIGDKDVHAAKQSLVRLRAISKGLQQPKDV